MRKSIRAGGEIQATDQLEALAKVDAGLGSLARLSIDLLYNDYISFSKFLAQEQRKVRYRQFCSPQLLTMLVAIRASKAEQCGQIVIP